MLTAALSLAVSALAIIVLLLLWKDFWVDELRNDLFAVRDRLFLYAAKEGLLDHAAHQLMRSRFNSMIRYAHEISLPRLIALIVAIKLWEPVPPRELSDLNSAVRSLPVAQRERFEAFHLEMAGLVARQLYKTSIFLRVVVALASVVGAATRGDGARSGQHVIERLPTEPLEADAVACAA